MASAVASKRVPLARLLERLLATSSASGSSALRPVAVAGGLRGYNTSGPLRRYDGDESGEDSGLEYDADRGARRYTVPSFFSDVLDPFSPPRSLSHLLNLMDDYAAVGRGIAPRRGWHAKDDDEALHLRVDLPGLGKEHVKVWAEQNSLVIKGEGEESEEEAGPRYSSRIDLPPEGYKMDSIKAEMKNGVLRVVVPKVKEEERKDVFQVTVE